MLREHDVEVNVVNRSVERGEALAAALGSPFIPLDDLEKTETDLLINTTPVGMSPKKDQCIVPEHVLKPGMIVMDIVYNPLKTKLLALASAKGCVTVDGLGMFIHQGAEQFRLWTGQAQRGRNPGSRFNPST